MLHSLARLYKPEIKANLSLSIPIIVGQLGIILMGVIDTLMIGRVGTTATAAAGASNNVFFLITILGIGAATVISPLVATAFQQKNLAECHLLLRVALTLGIVIGLLLTGIMWVLTAYFEIFRQEPQVSAEAQAYLAYVNFSIVPMLIFLAFKQFADGLSATAIGMRVTWIGFFTNTFANWLLIFGNWGFPALGLEGAGVGTLIARIVMMLCMAAYVMRLPRFREILQSIYPKQLFAPRATSVLTLGMSSSFAYFFESAAFASSCLLIGAYFGEAPQAAHQIVIAIASVTYMVISGIGTAGSIRVGQGLGRSSKGHILKAGTASLLLGGSLIVFFCILFIAFPYYFVAAFINEPKVIAIAVGLMIVAGIFQVSDGIQAVALGILRGVSDVRIPMYITFFAYWVIGIPVGAILGIYLQLEALGVWIGLACGLTVSAVLLTKRFYQIVGRMFPETRLSKS